jgi:hypothetical protein
LSQKKFKLKLNIGAKSCTKDKYVRCNLIPCYRTRSRLFRVVLRVVCFELIYVCLHLGRVPVVSFNNHHWHQSNTMEQNNVDNNDNVAKPVQVNRPALANPARGHICCTPPCLNCLFVTFSCLLIGAISMLIAGAYYYSIYAQYGGIDFRRECIRVKVMPERKINFIYLETTCILESAWYEYLGTDSYDVKIIVSK